MLPFDMRRQGSFSYSGFLLKISYTARTWATDIDSMLTEHIKNLVKFSPGRNRIGLLSLLRNSEELIGFITTGIFFLISVLGGFFSTNRFILSRLENTAKFLSNNTSINSKIDFLVNYVAGGEVARFYFFLTVFLLVMLVVSILVGFSLAEKSVLRSQESFILLTNQSRKEKDKSLRAEKSRLRNFLLSVTLAIFINLLSSYIFMYLTTK
jgi:hypothetical protein